MSLIPSFALFIFQAFCLCTHSGCNTNSFQIPMLDVFTSEHYNTNNNLGSRDASISMQRILSLAP